MLFALRYYDLENTGHTNLKQFRQFLTKFGIHHFEAEASQRLFQLFDTEQRGAVEHRELIARMLGTQVLPIGTSSKRSGIASLNPSRHSFPLGHLLEINPAKYPPIPSKWLFSFIKTTDYHQITIYYTRLKISRIRDKSHY